MYNSEEKIVYLCITQLLLVQGLYCLGFVLSTVGTVQGLCVQGLYCLGFVCLGFVLVPNLSLYLDLKLATFTPKFNPNPNLYLNFNPMNLVMGSSQTLPKPEPYEPWDVQVSTSTKTLNLRTLGCVGLNLNLNLHPTNLVICRSQPQSKLNLTNLWMCSSQPQPLPKPEPYKLCDVQVSTSILN